MLTLSLTAFLQVRQDGAVDDGARGFLRRSSEVEVCLADFLSLQWDYRKGH